MGKAKEIGIPPVVTVRLSDPGMTVFHKAGLAGLWMTLKAIETDRTATKKRPAGTGWKLDSRGVTLQWGTKPRNFLRWLIGASFRIDRNGLVWSPALGEPQQGYEEAALRNAALAAIHFQSPRVAGGKKAVARSFTRGGDQFELRFTPYDWIPQQRQTEILLKPESEIVGWVLPGATVRHESLKSVTSYEESRSRLLCLLYLFVGAIYYRVSQRRRHPKDKRKRQTGIPAYTMVLPEMNDLGKYARLRRAVLRRGIEDLTVSGTADAVWRVAVAAAAQRLLSDLRAGQCVAVSFGASPGTRQNARIEVVQLGAAADEAVELFHRCQSAFRPMLLAAKDGTKYWDIPQMPELIARNLAAGRRWQDWWLGFADFIADKVRCAHILSKEKGGLTTMTNDTGSFPEGPERTFVLACHEAWRRRMAQIGDKARRERSSFPDQVKREFTRLRTTFARCKNATTLREAVTDFWARAGSPLPPLQDGWSTVLPLMDDKNWRKAKDLALLALASYKPATKDEEKALEPASQDDEKEKP